jgi:hypothetical protein
VVGWSCCKPDLLHQVDTTKSNGNSASLLPHLLAVLTVSPNRQKRGIRRPTTPVRRVQQQCWLNWLPEH